MYKCLLFILPLGLLQKVQPPIFSRKEPSTKISSRSLGVTHVHASLKIIQLSKADAIGVGDNISLSMSKGLQSWKLTDTLKLKGSIRCPPINDGLFFSFMLDHLWMT